MANGRTERISGRDLEVLEFIARFGVVSREAAAAWAGTAQTCTLERERRLRDAGLIDVRCGVWGEGKLLAATRSGLALCGRGELRPARFSLATVRHETTVAELAAAIERAGERTLSEREIAAREREQGERAFSAELSGERFHRADLLRLGADGGPPQAIEIELNAKGQARLDELLRAWRWAVGEKRLSRVVYRCPPRIRPVVERAVERTRTARSVAVEEL
ncbi:MAG TPA: hypothetical protein VFI09_09790 [Solirubrobacterales bacterium]|nr:hypothetical protein [Solirubrobacterales bacterium]